MTRVESFNTAIRGVVTLALTAVFVFIVLWQIKVPDSVFAAFMATYNTVLVFWFMSREQKKDSNGNGHAPAPGGS